MQELFNTCLEKTGRSEAGEELLSSLLLSSIRSVLTGPGGLGLVLQGSDLDS